MQSVFSETVTNSCPQAGCTTVPVLNSKCQTKMFCLLWLSRLDFLWVEGRVCDPGERLLIFELNSQSKKKYTPNFYAAKATLIGWHCLLLSPSHYLCFSFTELELCTDSRVFFIAHTQWTAGGPWEARHWIWLKEFWIRITDYIFNPILDYRVHDILQNIVFSRNSKLYWRLQCSVPFTRETL